VPPLPLFWSIYLYSSYLLQKYKLIPKCKYKVSERGEGTASGRSDSEAVNKSESRGVSHNHYKDIIFCRKVIIKT
ncbi:MAG: hypothetical protein II661_05875, partial [Bacteroidales bacterium]|nr:hypothetical protein [Bacteroidales bacterium]